jgi:hypothetical protein
LDEARIGQKNKITRRWAKRGTRPSAPRDQRTASTYIFGAICPKQGKGVALILPACNTEAMNLHLAEIAKAVAPGAHAVLLVDQAGWHLSARLLIPANITILALPPKCPELNPVENIWQYMRDNWLSNRIFKSYDDIVARLEYARRPTLENHVHWTTPVGSWVLINETWYKRIGGPLLLPQRASFSNSSRERQALEALSN